MRTHTYIHMKKKREGIKEEKYPLNTLENKCIYKCMYT